MYKFKKGDKVRHKVLGTICDNLVGTVIEDGAECHFLFWVHFDDPKGNNAGHQGIPATACTHDCVELYEVV